MGRTVGGWRRRAPRARTGVALASATVALIALASACSSSGSDHSSVTSSRPFEQRSGSLIQADALGNTVIGGPDRTSLSFRFRATWTGSVAALRFYIIKNVNGRTGYSEGDGGVMRVSLQADSGRSPHVPAGRRLASATFRAAGVGNFPLVRFGKPARVVAGRLYHVVFSNIAPDPVRNFVSINAMYSASRLGRGPSVPDGLAVLEGDRGRGGATFWHPRRSRPHEYYLPILDVVGGRPGQHDGVGYMEVWDPKPIGGDAMVRQLLRVRADGAGRADGVWLRVRRDSGADTSLVVRLEQQDGHALASATVAPSSVPTSDPGWVHVRFSSPVSLSAGTDLALTLSAADTSAYEAFPIRKGTDYGFDRQTFFDGGYAQFNDGSGWVGWDQWGGHDRRISDLQFALDVAR
ncbi:MAG TPA: hypothetical protein VF257_15890 [Solirubrobacteraceae bacterium]